MTIIGNVLLIISFFALFGVFHSFLASNKVKRIVKERFPGFLPFYRLAYNSISIFTFMGFWIASPKPDVILFDLQFPFDILMLLPQFASLVGMIWTLKYLDGKEFLGITQIARWKSGTYSEDDLDESSELRIEGPYKFSRHPIYFFTILYLLAHPTMNLFYFLFAVCGTLYFIAGSIYEEKKLVEKFGDAYISYQKEVSRIIPFKPVLRLIITRLVAK